MLPPAVPSTLHTILPNVPVLPVTVAVKLCVPSALIVALVGLIETTKSGNGSVATTVILSLSVPPLPSSTSQVMVCDPSAFNVIIAVLPLLP